MPFEVVGSGGETVIAPSWYGALTMAHERGDTLLDYTDPVAPTVLEAGVYSFAATCECAKGPQRGGHALLIVGVGPHEGGVSVDQQIDLTMFPTPRASATNPPWPLEAGDPVGLVVWNFWGEPAAFRPIMGLLTKL